MTYINLDGLVKLHALVELDLQCTAVRVQGRQQVPVRCLAVNLDIVDLQMVCIENDILGLSSCDGFKPMDHISCELFLIKKNIKVGRYMCSDPVIVIAESIWVPRGVDYSRRHRPSLTSRMKSAADLYADGEVD